MGVPGHEISLFRFGPLQIYQDRGSMKLLVL